MEKNKEEERYGLDGWKGMINFAIIIAESKGLKEYKLPSVSLEDLYDLKAILDGTPVVV